MQVRRVRGRKYTDPDLISLIDAADDNPDLYAFVDDEAAALLAKLRAFDTRFESAFERICVVASMAGFVVRPTDHATSQKQDRDAVLVPTKGDGRRGLILYNPDRPQTRIVHSIAHEIVHSFFPNSGAGAQFRSLQRVGGPVPELEQLCDHGAGALTMPTVDMRLAVKHTGISMEAVDLVRQQFGTSHEATLYRMAKTATTAVAAGRFCYREPKSAAARRVSNQRDLFVDKPRTQAQIAKYRRQSFHPSTTAYPLRLIFPWNKSLPEESVAYTAARSGRIETAVELLEIKAGVRARFRIEVVPARYQPPGTDPQSPDLLVLLTLVQ